MFVSANLLLLLQPDFIKSEWFNWFRW